MARTKTVRMSIKSNKWIKKIQEVPQTAEDKIISYLKNDEKMEDYKEMLANETLENNDLRKEVMRMDSHIQKLVHENYLLKAKYFSMEKEFKSLKRRNMKCSYRIREMTKSIQRTLQYDSSETEEDEIESE